MAFDFPASPSIDQDYVAGTVTYTYNGTGWVLKGTNAGQFVSKSGDTMTGVLDNQVAIYVTNASPFITLRKPAVTNRAYIDGQSNSKSRWQLNITDGDPETGANAGNNFSLYSFKDDGTFLLQPFTVYRADGRVALNSTLASTSPTTGALTVAGGVGVGNNLYVSGAVFAGPNGIVTGNGGNSGIYYFGTATNNKILQWDTTKFNLIGGRVAIPDSTASTTSTSGALTVAGGVGIGGALCCSTISEVGDNNTFKYNSSQSPATGAVINVGFALVGYSSRGANDSGTWHTKYENISGSTVGNITTTATTTTYATSSDERLKDDFKSFDASKIIDGIKVYDFKWKASDERAIGIIAQEVEKIYPQAVVHSADHDDWWGIDYSKFVPLLLQELKSVRNRLKQLEDK